MQGGEKMKQARLAFLVVFVAVAMAVVAFAASNGVMDVKPGDEIYVCACGEACPCDTMSRNPGKCSCGKDLIKVKVTKVENGMVYVDGGKKAYKQTGKYTCACGPACKCDTVSQNPGKCTCGQDMVPVKP
jgi:hypothetical protein